MTEQISELEILRGENARLKDESRIGWLERALAREAELRRNAEHQVADLKAYLETCPYPDEVAHHRELRDRLARAEEALREIRSVAGREWQRGGSEAFGDFVTLIDALEHDKESR